MPPSVPCGQYWTWLPYKQPLECLSTFPTVDVTILLQFVCGFSNFPLGFIHPNWCRILVQGSLPSLRTPSTSCFEDGIWPRTPDNWPNECLPFKNLTFCRLPKAEKAKTSGNAISAGALGGRMCFLTIGVSLSHLNPSRLIWVRRYYSMLEPNCLAIRHGGDLEGNLSLTHLHQWLQRPDPFSLAKRI